MLFSLCLHGQSKSQHIFQPLFLHCPKQCGWHSVSGSLLLCWDQLLISSFIVFSLHYVQMEESSAQVCTAIGWTVPDVCTVLRLSVFFLGFYGYILFFIMCPNDFVLGKERFLMKSHLHCDKVLVVNPPILFSGSSNMFFVSNSRPNWNGSDQLYHTNLGENWFPCLSHLNTPP